MDTLLISEDDVGRIVARIGRDVLMDRVIERLAAGLAQAGRGDGPRSPARNGFIRPVPGPGLLEWMPYHDPGASVTVKIVSYSPDNPRRSGLPTVSGTVARFDDLTGRLTALADGVLLTAVRTGAASAIASRLLADPDSRVIGLVGAGAQAVTQLHALSRVFRPREVLVWDTDPRHAASFAARVAFVGTEIRIASPAEVAARSDIICTATSVAIGSGPVFPDTGVSDHAHVNAVGSDVEGKAELPRSLLERAFVCPDHLVQARREGECQQLAGRPVGPDLARLCADPRPATDHRNRLTVFDSTGFALEDHLTLDVFIDLAVELGLGTRMRLEYNPSDALDPYSPARGRVISSDVAVAL
jgi:alanine dehydrogenase